MILELEIHHNAFVAGALLQTPLVELTALPDALLVFSGLFAAGEGKNREGEGGREGWKGKRRGAFPHFFFLQFNHCIASDVSAYRAFSCYLVHVVTES